MTTTFTHPVIVVARVDGRGGYEPFGTYGKKQAGAKVWIGEKEYTVTKDGRVNIPKSVMNTGIKGSDGRMRIAIGFSSEKGINGWKNIKTYIVAPTQENKDSKKGAPLKLLPTTGAEAKERKLLIPQDSRDYNWSP